MVTPKLQTSLLLENLWKLMHSGAYHFRGHFPVVRAFMRTLQRKRNQGCAENIWSYALLCFPKYPQGVPSYFIKKYMTQNKIISFFLNIVVIVSVNNLTGLRLWTLLIHNAPSRRATTAPVALLLAYSDYYYSDWVSTTSPYTL